jgi:integrase/recombinase XerC
MLSPVIQPGYHRGRVPANKGLKYPVEVLTPDEAKRLILACSAASYTGIRNRALITVMYRGGLRLGEALDLRAKDIDQQVGTITVLHGKQDRRRLVGIGPEAMALISRWIDKRRELDVHGRAPLFCTLNGGVLHQSYVRTLLPRLATRAGIDKRVHPHALRHTHAFEVMMEGVPVPVIQQQLGHASLETTSRYLYHLAPKDLINRMQAREWDIKTA